MNRYCFTVLETRHVFVQYTVEASSVEEGRELAAAGDTIDEWENEAGEVIERKIIRQEPTAFEAAVAHDRGPTIADLLDDEVDDAEPDNCVETPNDVGANETDTAKELVWACPTCKSHRVQAQVWVRANTNEVLDDAGRYGWCDACEDDGNDGEIAEGGMIHLPSAETREGAFEPPSVTIEIYDGIVVNVHNLPHGWLYEIDDNEIATDEERSSGRRPLP